MNKLENLIDQKFMEDFFNDKKKFIMPQAKHLVSLKIHPIKRRFGKDFSHVVANYKLIYKKANGMRKNISVYSSAHSDGSRALVFKVLKFFYSKDVAAQKPLFYFRPLKAMFYEGVVGKNLLNLIFSNDKQMDEVMEMAAKKLAAIHQIKPNFRLKFKRFKAKDKVDPTNVLKRFAHNKQKYVNRSKKFQKIIFKQLRDIKLDKSKICHGDFHPENVVINATGSKLDVNIIDFSDTGLYDISYDLGSFLQQFDFMGRFYLADAKITKLQKIFLETYLKTAKLKLTSQLEEKILTFEALTALKSAIFFTASDEKYEAIDFLHDELKLILKKIEKIKK